MLPGGRMQALFFRPFRYAVVADFSQSNFGQSIFGQPIWPAEKIGRAKTTMAKNGLANIGFGQHWSNQDGQNGIGQSRSLPPDACIMALGELKHEFWLHVANQIIRSSGTQNKSNNQADCKSSTFWMCSRKTRCSSVFDSTWP